MSVNHLYIKNKIGLLVVGFNYSLSSMIAQHVGILPYNLYTDFTFEAKIEKLDCLNIFKRDGYELPYLGLSATVIKYIDVNELDKQI